MEYTPIYLFVMFGYNYTTNFIEEVFKDLGDSMIKHMQSKFNIYYKAYGSDGVFNKFYVELSRSHQITLENWIIKNYKG